MTEVYLDNASTTKVYEKSAEKILYMLTKNYGNPSSLHQKGISAENELDISRKIIAQKLNCKPNELFFTSGATESNNFAILGAAHKMKHFGNKIISTNIEHSSVMGPLKHLEKQGFEVVYIPAKNGTINDTDFFNAIDENTILVTSMLVNNETGLLLPINKIKNIIKCKNSHALLHTDAVQAFGKINVDTKDLDVDLLTVTAHKIHGPKGCAAIFIKNGLKLPNLLFGGEQEKGIRPGTENTALICGFAEAVNEFNDLNKKYLQINKLKTHLVNNLKDINNIKFNFNENCIPYIVNFSVMGIKSEIMLNYLSQNNIFVSNGSACSKGKKSYVLLNMGFPPNQVDCAIRVSFSRFNTVNDVNVLIHFIKNAIQKFTK